MGGRISMNSPSSLATTRAPAFADVAVERERLVLGEDVDVAKVGVDAVGEGDVDDAVLAGEGNRGLGAIAGEGKEPLARPARQQYAQSVFNRHDGLSRLLPEISLPRRTFDVDAPHDGVGEGQIYHNFVGMRVWL